jgi:hypothetical protein
MNDIIVVGLIIGLGIIFLRGFFSTPPEPPMITYIPVIRQSAPPRSSGCGPVLAAVLIIIVLLYFLLGSL